MTSFARFTAFVFLSIPTTSTSNSLTIVISVKGYDPQPMCRIFFPFDILNALHSFLYSLPTDLSYLSAVFSLSWDKISTTVQR